jgi:hypothetical protein
MAVFADEARAHFSTLKWRIVGDRFWPTAQARAIAQASRTAFNTARLCNSSDQPRFSLKEIGDHLGQRDPDATRI